MKKAIISLAIFFCFLQSQAQIGINTIAPAAQLDIKASNQATPANNDGLLIPKVDVFPATNPTVAQQGMMVYLTTTLGSNVPGFYYWNNATTAWIPVDDNNKTGWNVSGNTATNPVVNFIGTTDNVNVVFKRNNIRSGLIAQYSTAFGHNALNPASTGNFNYAFGGDALQANTTGYNNCAFGEESLMYNTLGNGNAAYGVFSLHDNTSGNQNTAVGSYSLQNNTTGVNNNTFGYLSMNYNTTGNDNAAFGRYALRANTTGSFNTAFGNEALNYNSTASYNAAFGWNALGVNTTGADNAAFGANALELNTTGYNNSAFGRNALQASNIGFSNAAFGTSALASNTHGDRNSAFGHLALNGNLGANDNSAFGFSSLEHSTGGNSNSGFGSFSLQSNTTGGSNSAFGYYAMQMNLTGANNAAFGWTSLRDNTSGYNNSAFGNSCLRKNTSGFDNTAVGGATLSENTTGTQNTAMGSDAMKANTSGMGNVSLGFNSLNTNTTGSYNMAIGYEADVASGILTNAAAIGYRATVSANNAMVLGGINGVNGATSDTNVGIGTTTPNAKLDIEDQYVATTLATSIGNLNVRINDPQDIDLGAAITLGGAIDASGTAGRSFAAIVGRKANNTLNNSAGYLAFRTSNGLALLERMRITGGGDIGIGTSTPGGQLELSLNEGRKPGSTTWTVTSDSRLKTIDGAFTKGLADILRLNPVRYHYKNAGHRKFEQQVLDTEFAGLIAQEVQPLFPDAVTTDGDGFLSFDIHPILIASINAFKELNQKNENLKQENQVLKTALVAQKQLLETVLMRLSALEKTGLE